LLGTWTDPGVADTHTPTWHILNASGTVVAAGVGAGITFTPLTAGVFTAVFTVNDDDGDSGRDTATIVVTDPTPEGPTVVILGRTDPLSSDLPPLTTPPEPGLTAALVGSLLISRSGSGLITPRLDGGNEESRAGNQTLPTDLFFPVGSVVAASSAPSPAGAPIVTSELTTAGFDPHSQRTQNLLRAETANAPTPRGGGSDDNMNLLSDHVKTKVLQTVVSPTIEDDSVGIVETLLNNGPSSPETATAPQDPGVSFLFPEGEPVPSTLGAEAAGAREIGPVRSIVVALLLGAPMLVGIWGDHRRGGTSAAP
jgi:hypothetical protein